MQYNPQFELQPMAQGAGNQQQFPQGTSWQHSSPQMPAPPAMQQQFMGQQPQTVFQQSPAGNSVPTNGQSILPTNAVPQSTKIMPNEQIEVCFSDVSYSIPSKTGPQGVLTILDGVSGIISPGQITAIMGPSGCGKTTLLDFLANRIASGNKAGTVTANGQPMSTLHGSNVMSYVQKEDALVGTVSVRQTFNFAANLKLQRSPNFAARKQETVNHLLKELGLESCAETAIGTVFKKGISGGQMRRVSIGIELMNMPRIILLDEPTSGLDASAALHVIEALQRLAAQGMAICCTMHQPSSEVFSLLDNILLLTKGQSVFFGPRATMVPHFAQSNLVCPKYANPADFVMRHINTDFEGHTDVDKLAQVWKLGGGGALAAQIARRREVSASSQTAPASGYAVGIHKQFWYLFVRQTIDNIKNPGIYWVRLFMYIMLSFMIGTIYLNIGHGQKDIQDRFYLLYFLNAFFVFMSIAVVPFFIQDLAVFTRERANGWYSPAAYVISGAFSCIPGLTLISLCCSVIIYFLVDLNGADGRFGLFFFNLCLSLYCAESVVLLLSAIVPIYIIAMALGAGVYGMFMLGEGGLILPGNIPDWWIWNYHIAFHTYAFESLMWTEFDGNTFECNPNGSRIEQACPFPNGETVLRFFDMNDVDWRRDMAIIAAMAVFYRICFFAWIQFRGSYKGKR
mmetsp:Transcript_11779/g.27031  ORF Transcript_11779/g.27031 Transcript_11779/m.27031 type:complete len:682 (+) Transcript_11779:59-2104(+)